MHPIPAILNVNRITDYLIDTCYHHNPSDPIDPLSVTHLSACIIEDLIIHGDSLTNTLPPHYPNSLFQGSPLIPKDDLYKLRKYIIIETLLDNNVPYQTAVSLVNRLEDSIINELNERTININRIKRVEVVYDTVILWIFQ